jgi:filamentous hemagglutinin family protein
MIPDFSISNKERLIYKEIKIMKRTLIALSLVSCPLAFSMPEEGAIVSGKGAIFQQGSAMEITTGHQTIIDWKSFSIEAAESVKFIQPAVSSAVLNQVSGSEMSRLMGLLQANGKVYLINPNGILIGPDAVINTASFIASTFPVGHETFLTEGDLLFEGDSTASIVHLGNIQSPQGMVALFAHKIDNQGKIAAETVSLGASHQILLKPDGNTLLLIRPEIPADGIENGGTIEALQAYIQSNGSGALGVNHTGQIKPLIITQENGKVFLRAEKGPLKIAGTVDSPLIEATGETFDIGKGALLRGEKIQLTSLRGIGINEGALIGSEVNVAIVNNPADPKPFYHLGTVDASGATGGKISIDAPRCLQAGKLLADGQTGAGGAVSIRVRDAYIETATGLTSVNSPTQAGKIAIFSGEEGSLFSSGKYQAVGKTGGTIHLLGEQVSLCAAEADASGQSQGGTILVGGDFQGGNPAIFNASKTFINGATKLTADAAHGDGGKVIIWSNEKTEHYGSISACAGQEQGNGGLIEISGKELCVGGTAIASAPNGINGNVLFDPKNIVVNATTGVYPQYQLINPGSGNSITHAYPLSSGNVVVVKPRDDFAATDAGAAYLFNGLTGALMSTLTGSQSNDLVGFSAVVLTNGNYVISSPFWANGATTGTGAATWASGTTGVSGVVSATNSLVGTTTDDTVGTILLPLTNGNYLVSSANWNNGAATTAGAVTWGNGTTGITGAVSAANSLVGTSTADLIGIVVVALTNGNYVTGSALWDDGATTNVGAVVWGNGTTGVTGPVTTANSLHGTQSSDNVGQAVLALTNGNYIIGSSNWDNGATTNVGAVTWGNGTTGTTGAVTTANSIVGTTTGDQISGGLGNNIRILTLTNGNFVILSPTWDNGAVNSAGAATWGNGTNGHTLNGVFEAVSTTNSLVGSTALDGVGGEGFCLTNGNYVILSPLWDNGATTNVGAATWVNGATGLPVGAVSTANSLHGTASGDQVGSRALIGSTIGSAPLTNGNYVIGSRLWDNGAVNSAGAATWGNGTTGITGAVTTANSIVGSQASDGIGLLIVPLTNGNFVILNPNWDNGAVGNAGAATWGNGTNGTTLNGVFEAVSTTNSLVGTQTNDQVGVTALSGNVGATALTNGNYVVISSSWHNGAVTQAGAVTWGNGTTGTAGVVSSSNSFVGTQANDQVGFAQFGGFIEPPPPDTFYPASLPSLNGIRNFASGITPLSDGNYVVNSLFWNNGAIPTATASTWGNGTNGTNIYGGYGAVNAQNSLVGQANEAAFSGSDIVKQDSVNGTFLMTYGAENGIVRVGLTNPNQISFARGQAQDMTITPSLLTTFLNAGTNVTMQANNDITISDAVTVNNVSGNGGNLSLSAGRSVAINGNITTDNGNLTIVANDLLANGVVDAYRDAGAATLSVGNGVTINVGTGNITMDLRTGAGKTNSTSGDLTIGSNASLLTSGTGDITLEADVNNIVLGTNSLVQNQTGTITMIAGTNITAPGAATIQNTGEGRIVLVVDHLFPTAPGVGSGIFNIPSVSILSGGPLAGPQIFLYAGVLNDSIFPATINGAPFDISLIQYYPNSSSVIFYKSGTAPVPPSPPTPTPSGGSTARAINRGRNAFVIATSEPFRNWQPWAYGPYLGDDRYPPDLTPKGLNLIIPSLVYFGEYPQVLLRPRLGSDE